MLAGYDTDIIYVDTPQEVEKRRKAFLHKWRARRGGKSGDRSFIFVRLLRAKG